jgi:hypothetical protein
MIRSTGKRNYLIYERERRPTVRLSNVLARHAFDLFEFGSCDAPY